MHWTDLVPCEQTINASANNLSTSRIDMTFMSRSRRPSKTVHRHVDDGAERVYKCGVHEGTHEEVVLQPTFSCSCTHKLSLEMISAQPTSTLSLRIQSKDSVTSQSCQIETRVKKNNAAQVIVESDTHDEHQARLPTKQVEGDCKERRGTWSSVQRVYKPVRQKVRWRCENCQTVFTTSYLCRTCEHQKCTSCTRDP